VAGRIYRWQKSGIWERILVQLQAEGDAQGELDWEVHFVDGSIVPAHQHAAGAKKRLQKQRRQVAAVVASVRRSMSELKVGASL
jgi:hypothetical protein